MKARALVEARVDCDRMLLASASALAADGDLLSPEERDVIDTLMSDTRAALTMQDPAQIEAATQTLAKGTEAFAALRMNRGIQQALAGRNIETV